MKHSWKLSITLTALLGGNPPTPPPATWFRSIFDPAANTLPSAYPAHRNISFSSQHLHSYLAGRLYPEKQQLVFPAFCSPCITPACSPGEPGWPCSRDLGHHASCWGWEGADDDLRSHVCSSSAARGYTHVKDQACPPALGEEGKAPSRDQPKPSLASPQRHNQFWWRRIIFTQLLFRVRTYLEKNPKVFPHSLFQSNNTPGFYNPPGQHVICPPSPRGKLLRAKSLHGRFLSHRVSFHKRLLIRAELLAQPLLTKPKLTANF